MTEDTDPRVIDLGGGNCIITLKPGDTSPRIFCDKDATFVFDLREMHPNAPINYIHDDMISGGVVNLGPHGDRDVTMRVTNSSSQGFISKHTRAYLEIDRASLATCNRIEGFKSVKIIPSVSPFTMPKAGGIPETRSVFPI